MNRARRARIVATLGPASRAPGTVKALAQAGVDVFRLNFSHGSHDDHAAAPERRGSRVDDGVHTAEVELLLLVHPRLGDGADVRHHQGQGLHDGGRLARGLEHFLAHRAPRGSQ